MHPRLAAWWQAVRVYRHPRVLAMLFLGFSAGLPFPMVFSTLSAWLRDFGIDRATIGFFAWIGLTYSVKFLWAPVVDRLRLPLLDRWLGKRRSWMLLAQAGLVTGLLSLAGLDPAACACTHIDLLLRHPGHLDRRLAYRSRGGTAPGRHGGDL